MEEWTYQFHLDNGRHEYYEHALPYESVYNNILGRSFLVVLLVVASMVHLNIKYHNDLGKLVVVRVDLHGS